MKSILLIVALLLLNACGEPDKKEVSKENFTKVLNDYYDRNCIGIDLEATFPLYEKENAKHEIDDKYMQFEKLGLVKLSDAKFDINKEIKRRGIINWADDPDKVKLVNGKKVELTEKGKNIYKLLDAKSSYRKARFCLANYKIKEITNYTKPESVMGMTIARVNYTAKPIKVVPFIDEITKIKSFDYFKDRTTKEISTRADLILTEMKGWIHNQEFKR